MKLVCATRASCEPTFTERLFVSIDQVSERTILLVSQNVECGIIVMV